MWAVRMPVSAQRVTKLFRTMQRSVVPTCLFVTVVVSQADAAVAVDDHVAFHHAILRLVPQEYCPPALPGAAVNADEHVVTNDPPFGEHGVDAANVVAAKRVRRVGRIVCVLLGAIVVEQAVFDTTIRRPDFAAVRLSPWPGP